MVTHRVTKKGVVDDRQWHFVRSFSLDSVAQIVGIALVLGGPLLYWGRSLESRVLTLENFNLAAATAALRSESDAREQRIIVNGQLEKMKDQMTALQISISQVLAAQAIPRPSPSIRR